MKNEFRDKLRQMSNVKESFKQELIAFMEKMASEGCSHVTVVLENGKSSYTNHGAEPPVYMIEKPDTITFDDIKDFFPEEDFKYYQTATLIKISWM